MNKSFWLAFGILALTSAFCLISLYGMVKERGDLADSPFTPSMLPTSLPTAATEASLPTVSPKDHTLEQIRELAAEYEQAVQAEKQNGDVEYSRDPATGEEVFRFQGESYTRISSLRNEFHSKLNGLIDLYAQIYRDETNPTPFPSPVSPEQKQSYLNSLYEQGESYCATRDVDAQDATIVFYDPEDGKYYPLLIDDEMARCYVHGWMIEEWRTAPMLAQVDHEADMVMIRVVTGKPNLNLRFQMISELANAPWQSVAVYADETGTRYSVDVESARLAAIEPNLPGHLNIPPGEQKSMDELRGIARQFALTNSPRLNELEAALLYEEHCKQSLCFFRWDYRNRDWTGTDWVMMPPFLQVGVLMSGQVVTYDNTLDLFK